MISAETDTGCGVWLCGWSFTVVLGLFSTELRSGARWGGQAMIEGRGNSRSEARKLEQGHRGVGVV